MSNCHKDRGKGCDCYDCLKSQKDAIVKREEDKLIAERDREWGLALCEIDVACHASSTRHGKISVTRYDEPEAPAPTGERERFRAWIENNGDPQRKFRQGHQDWNERQIKEVAEIAEAYADYVKSSVLQEVRKQETLLRVYEDMRSRDPHRFAEHDEPGPEGFPETCLAYTFEQFCQSEFTKSWLSVLKKMEGK